MLLAVWLILVGLAWVGWVGITPTVLGIGAIVVGALMLAPRLGVTDRLSDGWGRRGPSGER